MSPTPTRSLNVQTYCDARVIADLVREFERQGVAHKTSYSHVVYSILKLAWVNWNCEHFSSTEDALAFLSSRGFSLKQTKVKGRGDRLLRALQQESLADMTTEEA